MNIHYYERTLKNALRFKKLWDARKLTAYHKEFGLCSNVGINSSISEQLVEELNLPKPSSYSFPVAPPKNMTSIYAYYRLDRYDRRTEYGKNRYNYLLSVIEFLTKKVKDFPNET